MMKDNTSNPASHLSQKHISALLLPLVLFNITSFWGSSFTASPDVALHIKYAYVAGKAVLAALFVGMLLKIPPNSPHAEEGFKSQTPKAKTASLDFLLLLRAVACLLVVVGHFFCHVFKVENFYDLTKQSHLLQLFMVSPWIGVWIFFTLSGYLMGKGFFSGRYQLTHEDIRRFLANRALRIIPIYALVVMIVPLLMQPEIFLPDNAWMLIQILLFDYKGDLPMNPVGVLWSISTEFQFYLTVPFFAVGILALRKYFSRTGFLLGLALLSGLIFRITLMYSSEDNWYSFIYTPFISNLDIFLSGMLLSKIVADKKAQPPVQQRGSAFIKILTIMAALGLIGLACHWLAVVLHMPSKDMNKVVLTTIVCATTLLSIYFFETISVKKIMQRSSLMTKMLLKIQMIGTLSYCIYVIHEPIYLFLRQKAPEALTLSQVLSYFPLAFMLVMLCSYTLYVAIEKPFNKLKL